VLMSSLDICYDIYEKQGTKLMDRLLKDIKKLKNEKSYFLTQNDLPKDYYLDPTKLTLVGKKANINPTNMEIELRKNGIQIEFSNENYGVLVCSIMNESSDFEYLAKIMEMLKFKCYSGIDNMDKSFLSENLMSLSKAYYSVKKEVYLKESTNCISTEYIIPYPPGIPLIIPGDLIDNNKLELIKELLDKNQKIIGISKFDTAIIEVVSGEEA